MTRYVATLLAIAALASAGCESPTDPDDVDRIGVDDFVKTQTTPDPIAAVASDGRTYRVVRGNNQPDEILAYDWFAPFHVAVTITDDVEDEDVDLEFPILITAATVKVEQASGGIVNPPTGGQTEYFESVLTGTSSNRFDAANTTNTLGFDVWYDLPSLRKEAVLTITIGFRDNDGRTFQKATTVNVAP